MSEYQYYEFQALDRPLNEQEQAEVRALSSRVELTSRQAIFTYSYSSLRAEPLELLEKHFDALFYLANWGSKQLAFRLPRTLVDSEQLLIYSGLEEISLSTTEQHIVLDISFHEEEGLGWVEGEGILGRMLPLRDDILRGDLRALYLAWLKAASNYTGEAVVDDEDDDWEGEEAEEEGDPGDPDTMLEPPVPPGLSNLSPALKAFIEFFDIDIDLIAAAAEASPEAKRAEDRIEQWVTLLPETERNTWLVRVARGELHVGAQLLRRLRELSGQTGGTGVASESRRTFAALQAAAVEQKRLRKERERQEAERARLRKLDELAKREPAAWAQVTTLLEQKSGRAYDDATALLVDLRELAQHRGQHEQFAQRIATIQATYINRPAFQERLRKARLV